jgi:hypothetical protein
LRVFEVSKMGLSGPPLIGAVIAFTISGIAILYFIGKCIKDLIRVHRERNEHQEQFVNHVRELIAQQELFVNNVTDFIARHDSSNEEDNNEIESITPLKWRTDPFENLLDEECIICTEKLAKNTVLTKCYHKFHMKCIEKWEIVSRKMEMLFECPICKHDLYTELDFDIQIE